jgi:pyruvate/2-oxoglutarate dehydrogenase complex dihydrolipoamide acyltransferase (E2) component
MAVLIQVPPFLALTKNYGSKPMVTKWLKREGDSVDEGQTLVVIETTKASLEVEAPTSGMVFRIRKIGDRVKIGDPLGIIAASKEEMEEFRQLQQL